jgi:FlaA1/EpsC-like NDP-sugar epimerase
MMANRSSPWNIDELFDHFDPPESLPDLSSLRSEVEGKSIVITGAGGSIGSELAETILRLDPRQLLLLELSEHALYSVSMRLAEVAGHLSDAPEILPVIGSVCDARLLDHLFSRSKPEILYHAAAFKHVPLMEQNRFSVVANNAVGTYTLAQAALRYGARKLVLISTDKAVNPLSVMGASKRVAEISLLSLNSLDTHMTSIRLGNVLGSQGSVVSLFLDQIARGGPVTVTHPEACRYFLTLKEAVHRILVGAALDLPGRILVPEMGEPIRILNLARTMIARMGNEDIGIVYTGLRPGDKLEEEVMSADERRSASAIGDFKILGGPVLNNSDLAVAIRELQRSTEIHDEALLLRSLYSLVPEYHAAVEALR